MGRVEGWERLLLAVFAQWSSVPFVWGQSDCLHFCIACERAITGASVFDGFPAYTTRAGGFRHIKKMGFDAIPAFLDSRLPAVKPLQARRGDWVQMPENLGQAFGVCAGSDVVVRGEGGVIILPAKHSVRAWRIG